MIQKRAMTVQNELNCPIKAERICLAAQFSQLTNNLSAALIISDIHDIQFNPFRHIVCNFLA